MIPNGQLPFLFLYCLFYVIEQFAKTKEERFGIYSFALAMVLDNKSPVVFRSKIHCLSCFFRTAARERFWTVSVPILPPPGGFGAIFDFRDFQKGTLWTTMLTKNLTNCIRESSWECPWKVLGAIHDPKMVAGRPETRFVF